ncbi:hypothetical protein ACC702_37600, partial [Rhizobium ruizarguesonis]
KTLPPKKSNPQKQNPPKNRRVCQRSEGRRFAGLFVLPGGSLYREGCLSLTLRAFVAYAPHPPHLP